MPLLQCIKHLENETFGGVKTRLKRTQARMLLNVFIPIILGGLFYYFFCPDVAFVGKVDAMLGNLHLAKGNIGIPKYLRWVRNYGLDFLWAFSFSNAIMCFRNESYGCIEILAPILCGTLLEYFQSNGVLQGTFDGMDVFVEVLGAVVAKYLWVDGRNVK